MLFQAEIIEKEERIGDIILKSCGKVINHPPIDSLASTKKEYYFRPKVRISKSKEKERATKRELFQEKNDQVQNKKSRKNLLESIKATLDKLIRRNKACSSVARIPKSQSGKATTFDFTTQANSNGKSNKKAKGLSQAKFANERSKKSRDLSKFSLGNHSDNIMEEQISFSEESSLKKRFKLPLIFVSAANKKLKIDNNGSKLILSSDSQIKLKGMNAVNKLL